MNRPTITAAAIGVAMTLATLLLPAAAQASTRIVIHEIQYNPPGADTRTNSQLNAEWVKLHNTTGQAIRMTGWVLHDAGSNHVYTFGAYTIRAHGWLILHTGPGSNTPSSRHWGLRSYVWNNDGDTATLKNRRGVVQSRCSYSDPRERYQAVIC
jgi:hypothetical protein